MAFCQDSYPSAPPSDSLPLSASSPSTTPDPLSGAQEAVSHGSSEGRPVQGLPPAVQNQVQNLNVRCVQRKPKSNDKRNRKCSTSAPKIYTPGLTERFAKICTLGYKILGREVTLKDTIAFMPTISKPHRGGGTVGQTVDGQQRRFAWQSPQHYSNCVNLTSFLKAG